MLVKEHSILWKLEKAARENPQYSDKLLSFAASLRRTFSTQDPVTCREKRNMASKWLKSRYDDGTLKGKYRDGTLRTALKMQLVS